MNKTILATATALLVAAPMGASAENYIGGGYGRVSADDSGETVFGYATANVDADAWNLKVGHKVNDNFGVELRHTQTNGDLNLSGSIDGQPIPSTDINGKVKSTSLRGKATTNRDGFNVFGTVGFGKGEVSGYGLSEDDTSFVGSVGVSYAFNQKHDVELEFNHYGSYEGVDVTGLSLNYVYNF